VKKNGSRVGSDTLARNSRPFSPGDSRKLVDSNRK
jgi:hypothetical protein